MAGLFDDVTAARSNVLERLNAGEPVAPEEREYIDKISASMQSQFGNGLRRAAYNASATTDAFIGQMAEPFAPDFAQRQFTKAENTLRNQPASVRAEVDSFRDVDDLSSAASYASGALGEGLASVGTMVAAGLLSRGAAFRAAPAVRNAAQYAGGVAAMLPQEGGETALSLRQNPEAMANTTPAERAALTLGKGGVAAAMENIVPNLLFTNAITGTAGRIAAGARPALSNIGRKAAAGVVGEAGTEGAQELSGQFAENIAAPGTGYDSERVMEAAVRGAITGGVLGGAGGTIQAARSNIDAAAERAAEDVPRGAQAGLNAAVERLDQMIRNPEEFGADLTNTTMGALSEASARARDASEAFEEGAGPVAASGMEAISAIRQRFDRAVAGQLTPENRRKYVELTKNFRLLQPTEYERLRDALDTGDSTEINEAIGDVAFQLRERVPRETLQGLQNIRDWAKRFGQGVTRAYREGRKAAQAYDQNDVRRFRAFLNDQYPAVLRAMDNTDVSDQLARMLMTYRDNAQLLNAELRPKDREAMAYFEQETGVPLQDVLVDSRSWGSDNITRRDRQRAYEESTGDSQISRVTSDMERLLTPELQEQFAAEGIEIGPGATDADGVSFAEKYGEGITTEDVEGKELGTKLKRAFDEAGNQMDVERPTNTPFSSLNLVKRVLAADMSNGSPIRSDAYRFNPRYVLRGKLRSDDLTAAQIGQLLGGKDSYRRDDGVYSQRPVEVDEDTIAMRTTEDGAYLQDFNTIDIAAQAGKPWNEAEQDGYKENFEPFVPDFEGGSRDLGIQGYRLLSSIAALDTYGIEIPRSEIDPALLEQWGMDPEGGPVRINVDLPTDGLSEETLVQRKGSGNNRRDVTLGDLVGTNRVARSLPRQLALLESLGDNPNGELKKLEKQPGVEGKTADALSRGLYRFALEQEGGALPRGTVERRDTINSYREAYAERLRERIGDKEAQARTARNIARLRNGLRDELFTPEELREYRYVLERAYTDDDRAALEEEQSQIEQATTLEELEAVDTADVDLDKLATDDEALAWAEGLGLEADSTEGLVDTLIEFENGGLLEYEALEEQFNQEPSAQEPTADDEFDAYRRYTKDLNPKLLPRDLEQPPTPPADNTQAVDDFTQRQIDADNQDIAETEASERQRDVDETNADYVRRMRRARNTAPEQAVPTEGARNYNEELKNTTTEAEVDALQEEVRQDTALSIEEHQLFGDAADMQRLRIKDDGAARYRKGLQDGTIPLSNRTIRARAVNNWAKKFLPDGAKVRVVETDYENPDFLNFVQRELGWPEDADYRGYAVPASTINATGDDTSYIFLEPTPASGQNTFSQLSILAHEFGHLIQFEMHYADKENWQAINDLYKETVGEDYLNAMTAQRALELRPDLVGKVNRGEITAEQAMEDARSAIENELGGTSKESMDARLYQLGFGEWFAENFSRYAMNEPSVFAQADKGVRAHLDRILTKLKQFYNEVVKKNFDTNPTFASYIEDVASRRNELGAQTNRAALIQEKLQQETARSNKQRESLQRSMEQEPPGETPPPPQEPPQEPPGETPPPPPDNEAQKRFRETVQRLLGSRVEVEFGQELPEGVAAEYESRLGQTLEDTGTALKVLRESRREDINALKFKRTATAEQIEKGLVDERSIEEIEASIEAYNRREAEYLSDLAVRGTIRVAAGMEAQAGLAEHEAFHAAFEIFFGDNAAADRKAVTTAFSQGILSQRLRRYFAGNEEVLNVIDPNSPDFKAEEAAAYGFQVFLHEPEALQMGRKLEGIYNRFLQFLQRLVGYKTYEERAHTVFNDLASGRRAERGTSVLRDRVGMERSMLDRSQDFVRGVGSGFLNIYDALFSSSYSRLADSGNVALAQIARLGYNETGQEGQGMIQLERQEITKWSNRMKEALHALDEGELHELNQAMLLGNELTGKLGQAQQRLRTLLSDVHKYQTDAGVDIGFKDDYFPMIWDPEKVAADYGGFVSMLEQYPEELAELRKTADEIAEGIASYEERGHEFQGVFGQDGEPVADSSRRRTLDFIRVEDRAKYMTEDLVETMAHYLNQSVRHAEYVRAFGQNGARLKQLMDEARSVYGGSKQDIDLAKDYIDGLMGNKEVGMSRELKDLYGAATVYQNVRLLPLSVFSSLVDPLGIAVRTNNIGGAFDTFAYSMRNMFTDFRKEWTPDQWEKYAEDMGTIDMSGTVKSIDKIYTGVTLRGKTRAINDGFFKWNLLNGWVKNNHIGATKAAQLFLRRSAEGMFGEERSAENLQEVGVRPEDIVYDESLGRIQSTVPEILGAENMDAVRQQFDEESIAEATARAERIQKAIHKIVRQSMIQPSSAEMPTWMSNPYLAPIAHLKTFVFGFNKTILQRLAYEAGRGNYSPLYYAAAYVPGMIAADFIKGFAGNGGEEPEWKKNWTMSDYLSHGVSRSGLTGTGQFFADMNNDVTRGGGGWESLAGPTIEQAHDLMGAMSAKTSEPTKTWMVNALPVNDLWDQWALDY